MHQKCCSLTICRRHSGDWKQNRRFKEWNQRSPELPALAANNKTARKACKIGVFWHKNIAENEYNHCINSLRYSWCRWPDSNRHGIATGGFWVHYVCQFHHTGLSSIPGTNLGNPRDVWRDVEAKTDIHLSKLPQHGRLSGHHGNRRSRFWVRHVCQFHHSGSAWLF